MVLPGEGVLHSLYCSHTPVLPGGGGGGTSFPILYSYTDVAWGEGGGTSFPILYSYTGAALGGGGGVLH